MPSSTGPRLQIRALLLLLAAILFGVPSQGLAQSKGAGAADPAAAIVSKCRSPDLVAERRCYEGALMEKLRSQGAAAALQLLDGLAARDPDVMREGHMHAHGIGIAALERTEDVGEVFASCTPGYQSGCYHGVIQSYFLATQRAGGTVSTKSVDALCGDYRGPQGNAWLLFQCTHGLGHGLAMLHGHDLPQALRSCELLSRQPEQENCYAGAFMENIVNATHPHHAPAARKPEQQSADHSHHGQHGGASHGGHGGHDAGAQPANAKFKALDPADLHYPCSAVAEKYWSACYTIQTAAMLHHTGHDVSRTAQECGRAPEKVRATCFLSLGRDVSAIALGDHPRAVRLCALAEARYQPACNVGVVQAVVNMNANPADGLPYCRAVTTPDSKRACYLAIAHQASSLPDGAARRDEACRSAEEGYREACLGRMPAAQQHEAPGTP